MLSGAGGGAETSLGERRRTQDARQRESASPHFHPLTRPDKALGHSCGGRNLACRFRCSCGGRNLAAWGWGGPCHAERSRRRSRSISRVRASPIRTFPERFPSAGSGQALGSARNDNPPKASPSSILNSYASVADLLHRNRLLPLRQQAVSRFEVFERQDCARFSRRRCWP